VDAPSDPRASRTPACAGIFRCDRAFAPGPSSSPRPSIRARRRSHAPRPSVLLCARHMLRDPAVGTPSTHRPSVRASTGITSCDPAFHSPTSSCTVTQQSTRRHAPDPAFESEHDLTIVGPAADSASRSTTQSSRLSRRSSSLFHGTSAQHGIAADECRRSAQAPPSGTRG